MPRLDQGPVQPRFEEGDRVVCQGELGWCAGTVIALHEADPDDPTGATTLPYIVKLDPPVNQLQAVAFDAAGASLSSP